MNQSFMESVKATINTGKFNEAVTENGALGFRTTGSNLLDINFAVASLRKATTEEILDKWVKAYFENPKLAVKWLFFAGDIRGGLGERRLFRTILTYICETNTELAEILIPYIPLYTRWDYVLDSLDNPELQETILKFIETTLLEDLDGRNEEKPISLLAKWLPSVNSKNKETRRKALIICNYLGWPEKQYRKTLADLRTYLGVVEVRMCANKWNEINYAAVPSKANLIYKNAFMEHDKERREAFLESLAKGETKINASVLYPHDIAHKATHFGWYNVGVNEKDATVIELWKALPDYVQGNSNTIVVSDGSGSMFDEIGGSNISAIEVAASLAIYFSEHQSGQFKDNFITFSENPQLVDLSNCNDIYDKLAATYAHDECSNTNIAKVFDLLLTTAVQKHMTQEEFVDNVLIISDMEFDYMTRAHYNGTFEAPSKKLFEEIAEKYAEAGYKLPRLIFWNVNSRTGTIPVIENELGVALVSGFSPVIAKMVLSGKTDPFEVLLDTLNDKRYDAIDEAISEVLD